MRLIITGGIGSGKSRLANRIIQAYAWPVFGLRSLRQYEGTGRRSFALRSLTGGQNWPLHPQSDQTALFEAQVLPAMQAELERLQLNDAPACWLVDELGRCEQKAERYLDFIRQAPAKRQIIVVRREMLPVYNLPCDLLADLESMTEKEAFGQALSLFGPTPVRRQTRLILMASGFSRRFDQGQDKLLSPFDGRLLVEHALALAVAWQAASSEHLALVCARQEAILRLAHQEGLIGLYNPQAEEGISASIRLGLGFDPGYPVQAQQSIFLPADQPHLRLDTLIDLCTAGAYQEDALVSLMDDEGRPGSPVLFGADYSAELLALKGDQGGRRVFARHPQKQRFLKAEALELQDYDSNFG